MPGAAKEHIGLLRAVNVAAHNKVGMADLRALLESLGFENVRTLLQSGNVVFGSSGRTTTQLETVLEEAAATRLRLETQFFVRTAKDWQDIVDENPFPKAARDDPGHLVAFILKTPTTAARVTALQEAVRGREVVRGNGRCTYIVYPDGIGNSKLTNTVIEKALGTRGTARNWNTVLKLQAQVNASRER